MEFLRHSLDAPRDCEAGQAMERTGKPRHRRAEHGRSPRPSKVESNPCNPRLKITQIPERYTDDTAVIAPTKTARELASPGCSVWLPVKTLDCRGRLRRRDRV